MLIRLIQDGETIFVKQFTDPVEQPESLLWNLLDALALELVIRADEVRPLFENFKTLLGLAP